MPPKRTLHPTEKPIPSELLESAFEQSPLGTGRADPDPFMGSGINGHCLRSNASGRFVGVEIDRRWFDVAVERINRQTNSGSLFAEPVVRRQTAMELELA